MENLINSNYLIFFFLNILLASSILTLSQKNPIYSILFLILTFTSFVLFLVQLGIEFIALLFLIIYVGAISILFLFVIMMLNVRYIILDNRRNFLVTGLFLIFIFLISGIFILVYFTTINFFNFFINEYSYFNWIETFLYKTDIESIGFILFNFFYLEFCLSGIVLLVAMIGSISLVISSNKVAKTQIIDRQLKKTSSRIDLFFLKQ